jgi:hypothetical protein
MGANVSTTSYMRMLGGDWNAENISGGVGVIEDKYSRECKNYGSGGREKAEESEVDDDDEAGVIINAATATDTDTDTDTDVNNGDYLSASMILIDLPSPRTTEEINQYWQYFYQDFVAF